MKFKRRIFLMIGMCSVLGCAKGTPTLETISDGSLPQPRFSGQTSKAFSTSVDRTFDVQGECDPKIREIVAIAPTISSSNSSTITVGGINVSCSADGKFSLTLKKLQDMGFALASPSIYNIELRGITDGGISKASVISITYNTALGGTHLTLVTAGGTGANRPTDGSPGGYSAEVRIGGKFNNGDTASSADGVYLKTDNITNGYRAHTGVRIKQQ